MSTLRVSALAIATLASGLVLADEDRLWSVAVDYGDTTFDGSSGTDFGLPYRNGDSTEGVRLAVARALGETFSIELAHDELGTLTTQAITVLWTGPLPVDLTQCPGVNCTVSGGTFSYDATADTLSLRAGFDPAASFRLSAELGFGQYRFGDSSIEDQSVVLYGLGAAYLLDDAWSIELRYSLTTIDRPGGASDDLTTLRLGVRYGF